MACPKKLHDKISRKNAADRIDECVEMLRRVKRRIHEPRKVTNVPGVCKFEDMYCAYINHKKKQVQLGRYETFKEAAAIRKKAEEAKRNNEFEFFIESLRMKAKAERRPKGYKKQR